MKNTFSLLIVATAILLLSSCNVFKPKYGCGNNGGRNVGAEKLLSGEQPKKVKKFKA